jgi:hypothetical protein
MSLDCCLLAAFLSRACLFSLTTNRLFLDDVVFEHHKTAILEAMLGKISKYRYHFRDQSAIFVARKLLLCYHGLYC